MELKHEKPEELPNGTFMFGDLGRILPNEVHISGNLEHILEYQKKVFEATNVLANLLEKLDPPSNVWRVNIDLYYNKAIVPDTDPLYELGFPEFRFQVDYRTRGIHRYLQNFAIRAQPEGRTLNFLVPKNAGFAINVLRAVMKPMMKVLSPSLTANYRIEKHSLIYNSVDD